jgi:hypothetical protein
MTRSAADGVDASRVGTSRRPRVVASPRTAWCEIRASDSGNSFANADKD